MGEHLAFAVHHQAVRWTYTELKNRVAGLAAGLLALDMRTRPFALGELHVDGVDVATADIV